MYEYLVKFRSSFMPEGKWSASTIQAQDIISARQAFWDRIKQDWGNDMVQHIGIIEIKLQPEVEMA
jgi:hypothetical protein